MPMMLTADLILDDVKSTRTNVHAADDRHGPFGVLSLNDEHGSRGLSVFAYSVEGIDRLADGLAKLRAEMVAAGAPVPEPKVGAWPAGELQTA